VFNDLLQIKMEAFSAETDAARCVREKLAPSLWC